MSWMLRRYIPDTYIKKGKKKKSSNIFLCFVVQKHLLEKKWDFSVSWVFTNFPLDSLPLYVSNCSKT